MQQWRRARRAPAARVRGGRPGAAHDRVGEEGRVLRGQCGAALEQQSCCYHRARHLGAGVLLPPVYTLGPTTRSTSSTNEPRCADNSPLQHYSHPLSTLQILHVRIRIPVGVAFSSAHRSVRTRTRAAPVNLRAFLSHRCRFGMMGRGERAGIVADCRKSAGPRGSCACSSCASTHARDRFRRRRWQMNTAT